MVVDNRDDNKDLKSNRNFEYNIWKSSLLRTLMKYRKEEGYNVSKRDFVEVVIDIEKLPSDIEISFD